MIRRPPRSPLFPSTTLFRSHEERAVRAAGRVELRPRRLGEAALAGDLGEHLLPAGVDGVGGGLRAPGHVAEDVQPHLQDRKSTRLNSSHANIPYAGFCLTKQ